MLQAPGSRRVTGPDPRFKSLERLLVLQLHVLVEVLDLGPVRGAELHRELLHPRLARVRLLFVVLLQLLKHLFGFVEVGIFSQRVSDFGRRIARGRGTSRRWGCIGMYRTRTSSL